jgi:hypothetical protein
MMAQFGQFAALAFVVTLYSIAHLLSELDFVTTS